MRDPQLAGDDAGPDPVMGHLHDLVSDVVGQRPAVNEDPSELVDPSLAQRSGHCGRHKVTFSWELSVSRDSERKFKCEPLNFKYIHVSYTSVFFMWRRLIPQKPANVSSHFS